MFPYMKKKYILVQEGSGFIQDLLPPVISSLGFPFMSWIITYLAFDECGPGMKRMVDWDDEDNGESDMKPSEEAGETDVSDDEQSDDEEPQIKNVLENLSKTVSRKRASDLLHSMAASKDILFWTPRGQLLRKNRIIPVTNIAELVECILMPHNEVIKPRALNAFLDGLAEIGDDKRLTKNKKILSDLLEKERVYQENEGEAVIATVATVVTASKVNLKAMMRKVIASFTKKESLKKSPRNHVEIVKIGICP